MHPAGRSATIMGMGKVRAGDGRALRPMHSWQALHRTMFGIEHLQVRYVVDVSILGDEAFLYVDGAQRAKAEMPCTFPITGGRIEAASSTYGLKRMHLVLEDGTEHQLFPAPLTAEAWRARLGERHPRLSSWLARAAVVVLLLGLAVVVPEVIERLSQLDVVAENIGTFTSPLTLPGWLATTLTVAGAAAGLERALTLRNHWLIDVDTFWIG